MNPKCLVAAALICLPAISAGAAVIEFNPGLWETVMTRTNPMTGEPITETRTECVQESKFDRPVRATWTCRSMPAVCRWK